MEKQLKRPLILGAVMLGMFLSAIEALIVATAMPSIVYDLGGFTLYSWVFSSYLLTSSATVLLFGKLADLYGRRPVYVIGIAIFLIGSMLAGYSSSMVMLIFARFIQGVGAGAIVPVATTIVGDIYSKEERAKIQGYLSSVWGVSAIIGPLLGAFFVDFLNWRYVFWMNIPLGLLSGVGILIFLRESFERKKGNIDYIGAALLLLMTSIIMFILVELGNQHSLASLHFFILIVVTGGLFLVFIFFEKKAADPIMPPSIWTNRMIRFANIATLLTGMIMIGVSSYLPMFVQGVMGKSAMIAGFSLTTMSIGWPAAATVAGRILLKIGYRKTSIIGGVKLLLGAICFMFLPAIEHVIWASFSSLIVGIGMGLTSTAFIVGIQTTVPWQKRGIATASNTFMRSFGSALGVALLGGVLNNQIQRKINDAALNETVTVDEIEKLLKMEETMQLAPEIVDALRVGLSSGLQIVYIVLGVIAILSIILIFFLPKRFIE